MLGAQWQLPSLVAADNFARPAVGTKCKSNLLSRSVFGVTPAFVMDRLRVAETH